MGIGGKVGILGIFWKGLRQLKKRPILAVAFGIGTIYLFSGLIWTTIKWSFIIGIQTN